MQLLKQLRRGQAEGFGYRVEACGVAPSEAEPEAEAESLGQDGDAFAQPQPEHRVLVSADGRTVEELDLDLAPDRYWFPHVVAPDGWIALRPQHMTPDTLTMDAGYRIDPGG